MEVRVLDTFLVALMIISSFAVIISVLMSPVKTQGLGAIEGGAETLFGKHKARGFDAFLEKVTIISAIVFMLSAFMYAVIAA